MLIFADIFKREYKVNCGLAYFCFHPRSVQKVRTPRENREDVCTVGRCSDGEVTDVLMSGSYWAANERTFPS